MLRLTLAGLLVVVVGSPVLGQGKKPADKKPAISQAMLVGTWESKPKEGTISIEFTKDGKINATMTPEGGKALEMKGSYTLTGDKLATVLSFMGKEKKETLTIESLTATKMVTVDEKGKKDEFTKKK